jgi:hypothetical protein
MNYILLGGAVLLGLLLVYRVILRANLRRILKSARWIVGGVTALLALWLLLRGQVGIGSMLAFAAISILRFGRLGPLVFGGDEVSEDNESTVRSRYIAMNLDHATGEVSGRVVAGAFRGADLIDLGEDDTRALLGEVAHDSDSLALLETWLDKHREGWREYFAEQYGADFGQAEQGPQSGQGSSSAGRSVDPDAEAYEVLGLKPGATPAEIREAHRNLMKRVHPDQGGSTYLASRINEAKDRLLKKHGAG